MTALINNIEVDSIACQLFLDRGVPPNISVECVEYKYAAAALCENGNLVLVFQPVEEGDQ